jgi:transcriptional regulator with GAF, ATPase, and Fis domain
VAETMDNRHLFEQLVSEISVRLIRIAPDRVDEEIHSALEEIREFFSVDRCGLMENDHDKRAWQITHYAFHPDIQTLPVNEPLPRKLFPWVYDQLVKQHRVVEFSSTDQLPREAGVDKATYHEWGIQSVLALPIMVDGEIDYNMVITADRHAFAWPEVHIPRLRLLGEVLVKSLVLARSQISLAVQRQFETLVSSISAGFLLIQPDSAENRVDGFLEKITDFFDVDHCSLVLFSGDGTSIVETHEYDRSGSVFPGVSLWKTKMPWYTSQLVKGESIQVNGLDDLPDNATKERRFLSDNQIQSIFSVPVKINSNLFGVCTVSCRAADRIRQQQEMIKRFRFIAELLVTGIARKHVDDQLRERMLEIEGYKDRLEAENIHLKKKIFSQQASHEIVARSKAMKTLLLRAEQVASMDTTVLVLGETGVGKELLARELHRLSKRRDLPLVTVNCASLPPSLIEGELFGREKGAYTGALTRMMGRFEAADKATLFLDEIGELPKEIQSKLLRVVEQGQFERLGSNKTLQVDVRLIAATNRNLDQEVAEGNFRNDLYYRLNVFPIQIPPLQERTEDIPPLVWSFIREFEKKMGKRIEQVTDACMKALMDYDWPGNIRELKNVIEHAMILAHSRILSVLPPFKQSLDDGPGRIRLEEVERDHVIKILRETGWRISGPQGAAQVLGMKRTTLQSRIKKLGIRRPQGVGKHDGNGVQ